MAVDRRSRRRDGTQHRHLRAPLDGGASSVSASGPRLPSRRCRPRSHTSLWAAAWSGPRVRTASCGTGASRGATSPGPDPHEPLEPVREPRLSDRGVSCSRLQVGGRPPRDLCRVRRCGGAWSGCHRARPRHHQRPHGPPTSATWRARSNLGARVSRGPVGWDGSNFERFRREAVDLLSRRWHALTLATLVGSLSVFAVLVVSLRALDVPPSQSLVEAFAAPVAGSPGRRCRSTGGVGIIELGDGRAACRRGRRGWFTATHPRPDARTRPARGWPPALPPRRRRAGCVRPPSGRMRCTQNVRGPDRTDGLAIRELQGLELGRPTESSRRRYAARGRTRPVSARLLSSRPRRPVRPREGGCNGVSARGDGWSRALRAHGMTVADVDARRGLRGVGSALPPPGGGRGSSHGRPSTATPSSPRR